MVGGVVIRAFTVGDGGPAGVEDVGDWWCPALTGRGVTG
jgi:hypothetical protein